MSPSLWTRICNIIFQKWGEGVEGRLEFFQKFIRFGSAILPLVSQWQGHLLSCPGRLNRTPISRSIQKYLFSVVAFFWKNCKSVQINCCLFGELVYFVASKNSLQYFLWMIWSRNLQQEKEECIFSWSCATYEVAVETTIISTKNCYGRVGIFLQKLKRQSLPGNAAKCGTVLPYRAS